MTCPNCQAQNPDDARFCNVCGQALPSATAAPTAPQPPAADQPGYAAPAGGAPTTPTPQVAATAPMGVTPPPPPTPPPSPPTGGGLPPGAVPRKGFNAGMAALAAFVVVVLLGSAIWFFAIRPSKADEPPAPPTTTPPTVEPTDEPTEQPTEEPTVEPTVEPTISPTGEPTFGTTEAPPTEEPQPPGQVSFSLNVCGNVGPRGACIQPGFVRSANSRHFFVLVNWDGAQDGDQVAIDYISTETGAPVSQTNSFTLIDATGFLTVEFQGPFPRISFEIVLSYNGQQLQFDRPPVVTLS